MKIRIEIDMSNAAFEEAGQGVEVARILRKLSDELDTDPDELRESFWDLRDINGNVVGRFTVAE